MTKTEEQDSIEKVSEDIRNATALVASFHERLVALGADSNGAFYQLRDAVASLMTAREALATKIAKEEK